MNYVGPWSDLGPLVYLKTKGVIQMAKTDKAETKAQTKGEAAAGAGAGATKAQGEGQASKVETKPAEVKAEAKPTEAAKPKINPMAMAKLEVSIVVKANADKPVVYNMAEVSPSKNYRKFAIRADEDKDIYGQVYVWIGTEE